MDLNLPELVGLTLRGLASLLFLLAAIDTGFAMLLALSRHEFSGAYATGFLLSHVVQVWFPILALAILGHGIAPLDVPPIGAFTTAAELGLVAYAISVVASLKESVRSTSAPGG